MRQPYLSVVIPTYNEKKRIKRCLDKLDAYFSNFKYSYEVIFVNDKSSDRTEEVILKNTKNKSNYKLISNEKNNGKGYAVKRGMLEANGRYILFIDVDLSTPIEEIGKLLKYIKDNEVVIGSRYLESSQIKVKQSLVRQIISRGGNWLMRIVISLPYKDTQCGFKLFQHEAAKKIFSRQTINRWGFDMEILVIARIHQLSIKEVAVDWSDDSSSQLRAGRDAWETLKELFKIKSNIISKKYQ